MASTAIVIMGFFSDSGKFGGHKLRCADQDFESPDSTCALTSCRVPVYPCNTRNAGKPDAAASSHGNGDIWPEREQAARRVHAWYWCGVWNVVVLGLALHYSLFLRLARGYTQRLTD
jgi:hypothetical protein